MAKPSRRRLRVLIERLSESGVDVDGLHALGAWLATTATNRHGAKLGLTLQALRDHPGVGGDLLLIGLRSPVVRNRNMALNALQSWPSSRWPDGTLELLRVTARSDPYEPTRALAAEILGKV